MDLSICIVSWNTRELLRRCIESIEETVSGLEYETIVVDNASSDGSAELIQRDFPRVQLIANRENRGFARANNQGIAVSQGRHVLLLNSDAVLLPGAARTMVDFLDSHPKVGVVGARLLNADGSFQASFADFPSLVGETLLLTGLARHVYSRTYPSYPEERSGQERAVDWIFGACMLVRRAAIDAVGAFDEDYFMYTEETDWCYRMRQGGWAIYYLPDARVKHWSGQSSNVAPLRKRSQLYRSKWLFLRKHRGRLRAEAFYLTLRVASALKLALWGLGSISPRRAGRDWARQQVRSYAVLLRELGKDVAVKILLATHFFPPGHPGGTESYTHGLARMLQRLGHLPRVICAEDWGTGASWLPRPEDTVHDGIPVRRLYWNWEVAPDPFVNLYDNRAVEKHFEDYLRETQPDIVHITSCYALGAGIIRAARRLGVPVFLTLTDFWFLCPRHTLLRGDGSLCPGPESAVICAACLATNARAFRTLSTVVPSDLVARGFLILSHYPSIARRRGLRGFVGDAGARFDHLRAVFDEIDVPIAPSRFLIDMFGRNGYPAERIRHSPYGMDLTWLPGLHPRAAGAPLCFGYIGQIDPLKGVDVLVKAFNLASTRGGVTLEIHGDLTKRPGYADQLRALAGENPWIHFKGPFARSQVADVLSGLDVVVVPSMWYENTPLVIYEAFAAGKPVIATNLGGMSEVVSHGVNGLLFERGDPAGLADAIRALVEDPGLRERLASQVPPVPTIEVETEGLVRMYREMAASRAVPPAAIR